MRCPKCGCQDDKVIDSRASREGAAIRRRRECTACGHRYTTYEQIERARIMVRKADGRCEEFSRVKLLDGIQKAFQKLKVAPEQVEAFVDRISDELANTHDREVSTREIGLKVMQELRGMDGVAYVRYASVYRRFEEAAEFLNEVKKLEKKDDPLTARLPGL